MKDYKYFKCKKEIVGFTVGDIYKLHYEYKYLKDLKVFKECFTCNTFIPIFYFKLKKLFI